MAVKNQKEVLTESVLATEDMDDIYRFITSAGAIAGAGEKALGVLQAETDDTKMAPVACLGIILTESGGVFAINDKLTSDSVGRAVKHELNEVGMQMIAVAADQALSEVVTLTAATSLTFPVVAGGTYLMKGELKFTNADSSAARGVDLALAIPSGATATGFIHTVDSADLNTSVEVTDFTSATVLADLCPLSSFGIVKFEAIITVSTTAGNVVVMWAQETSDADAMTLLNDSFVEMSKVLDGDYVNGIALDASTAAGEIVRVLINLD